MFPSRFAWFPPLHTTATERRISPLPLFPPTEAVMNESELFHCRNEPRRSATKLLLLLLLLPAQIFWGAKSLLGLFVVPRVGGIEEDFFSRLRFLGWERFLDISLPFLFLQTWKLMRGTYFGLPRMRKRDEYPTKPSLSRGAFLVTRDEGRSHPRLRWRKKMKPFSAKKNLCSGGRVQKTTSNKRLGRKISIAQFSLLLAVAAGVAGGNEKLCCSSLGFCIFHFPSPLPRRRRAPKKSSLPTPQPSL